MALCFYRPGAEQETIIVIAFAYYVEVLSFASFIRDDVGIRAARCNPGYHQSRINQDSRKNKNGLHCTPANENYAPAGFLVDGINHVVYRLSLS
jgi:hypothetical protein